MTRRALLARLLGVALLTGSRITSANEAQANGPRTARVPRRVVALDWVLTEMLLSLGIVPVGVANPPGFRRNFPASNLPESVIDVGLIFQPNMELLLMIKPDAIVISPAHVPLRTSLDRIAPTLTFSPNRSDRNPYAAACAATLGMAERFDCKDRGAAVLAEAAATIERARRDVATLPAAEHGPVFVTLFIDALDLRVFGPGSLFGTMLTALGLDNAWRASTNAAGFATTGIEALNGPPDAVLVYLAPLPVSVAEMMKNSRLWSAMSFKNVGRIVPLPTIAASGGVVSAAYFAGELARGLLKRQRCANPLHGTDGANHARHTGAGLGTA